MLIGHIWFSTL